MLNKEATELSRKTIPEQMKYLKHSFPFLRKLHLTDASEDGKYAVDVKMDYFGGIDAYGKDLTGSFTDAEIADMIFEAIDDEKFANGAIDLSYTQESLRERVNAMKAEGVYVRVAFDAPYKHGNYTFQTVTVLGNPKLLGVEFQLDSQCYGYASNIAKIIAEKA